MRTAVVIAWLLTAGGGLTMFSIWAAKGGLRETDDQRVVPRATTPPVAHILPWKVGTHALLAALGLGIFVGFLAQDDEVGTGYDVAPWLALSSLVLAAGFGASMAIPWARERKARKAAGVRTKGAAEHSIPLPVAVLHGLAGTTTIVLLLLVALELD